MPLVQTYVRKIYKKVSYLGNVDMEKMAIKKRKRKCVKMIKIKIGNCLSKMTLIKMLV